MFKYISHLIDDPDPVIIMPYGGYANDKIIIAQARVLEDEGLDRKEDSSIIQNLYRSFKRFETDEKENVQVEAFWQGKSVQLQSDDEGYIYLNEQHGLSLNHHRTLWLPVTFKLDLHDEQPFEITSNIMKPSRTAEFGIISDMDETLIHTGLDSTLRWKVIVNTFLRDSEERLPLDGALELCKKLHGGSNGYAENPFFYLSNSPWNIHDYLLAFLEKQNFPKGVLLLRDIGLQNRKKDSFFEGNKYVQISRILNTFPKLKFVLIGDAEDKDPEIYESVAKNFPHRIRCIYIRSVTNKGKMERVAKLIESSTDVQIKLIEHSSEAINHAKNLGLI